MEGSLSDSSARSFDYGRLQRSDFQPAQQRQMRNDVPDQVGSGVNPIRALEGMTLWVFGTWEHGEPLTSTLLTSNNISQRPGSTRSLENDGWTCPSAHAWQISIEWRTRFAVSRRPR